MPVSDPTQRERQGAHIRDEISAIKNTMIRDSLERLRAYVERQGYKGWDPYDGLNSRLLRSLAFVRNSRNVRLAWIQLLKRLPVNLRRPLGVPEEHNPKALALFVSGYCSLYRITPDQEILDRIVLLADRLMELKTDGYSGACWGYNFDWQSRGSFWPRYTPTVVVTSFAGYALLDAYDATRREEYLSTAFTIRDFILKDLNRSFGSAGNFAFSYSPYDTNRVYNASLLGSRILARLYGYSGDAHALEAARASVAYCFEHQAADGSWVYSPAPYHQWIDSFHTGFNLECIGEYQKYSGDRSFDRRLKIGIDYYLNTFFTEKGVPKYYADSVYPVDVHATAQLLVTVSRLGILHEYAPQVERVAAWTIRNMQDNGGYFYYQKRKLYVNRIAYMRWSQAWMFHALSAYLAGEES